MIGDFTCPACGGHYFGTDNAKYARNIVSCHTCGWRGTRAEAGLPVAKEATMTEVLSDRVREGDTGMKEITRPPQSGHARTPDQENPGDGTNHPRPESPSRALPETLDWSAIRDFFIRRKFLRGKPLAEDTYDAICARLTTHLPRSLRRELSVWIDGYLRGRE